MHGHPIINAHIIYAQDSVHISSPICIIYKESIRPHFVSAYKGMYSLLFVLCGEGFEPFFLLAKTCPRFRLEMIVLCFRREILGLDMDVATYFLPWPWALGMANRPSFVLE